MTKNEKTSNIQGSGIGVKIVPPDLPSEFLIENKEDKTEKILEEYSNKQTVQGLKKNIGDLDKIRDDLFTLFGLFASVVAFLLVEVQILSHTCSKGMMIGLTFILLGALSFFVILIKVLLTLKDDIDFKKDFNCKSPIGFALGACLLFVVIGLLFSILGRETQCRTETIIQQYQEKQYEKILLNEVNRNTRKYPDVYLNW